MFFAKGCVFAVFCLFIYLLFFCLFILFLGFDRGSSGFCIVFVFVSYFLPRNLGGYFQVLSRVS